MVQQTANVASIRLLIVVVNIRVKLTLSVAGVGVVGVVIKMSVLTLQIAS